MKILMSIKPRFWKMIREGKKTYELRRLCPYISTGDHVVVYASSPISAVVGSFGRRSAFKISAR